MPLIHMDASMFILTIPPLIIPTTQGLISEQAVHSGDHTHEIIIFVIEI